MRRCHAACLFDARVIQDHFPGIGRYALNLLRTLPALLQPDERLIVLHDPAAKNTRLPSPLSRPRAQPRCVSFVEHRAPLFGVRNAARAPAAAGRRRTTSYYVRPLARGRHAITTMYDAISFVYPQVVRLGADAFADRASFIRWRYALPIAIITSPKSPAAIWRAFSRAPAAAVCDAAGGRRGVYTADRGA